ncbi:MAG: dehydrogenase (quinone), partial [Candidatus Aminicenantes bacterium]|nr:dehydrogenase (quinone) [Candidatus Aminicenantes bacterium]
IPIIGSFAVPLAGLLGRRVRSVWAVLVSGITAVLPLTLLPFALRGGELVVRKPLVLGLDFILVVDPLSIFMAAVSSFIGFFIVVYSLGYIRREENQSEYYLMVVLFIGSMMGLVFSSSSSISSGRSSPSPAGGSSASTGSRPTFARPTRPSC